MSEGTSNAYLFELLKQWMGGSLTPKRLINLELEVLLIELMDKRLACLEKQQRLFERNRQAYSDAGGKAT